MAGRRRRGAGAGPPRHEAACYAVAGLKNRGRGPGVKTAGGSAWRGLVARRWRSGGGSQLQWERTVAAGNVDVRQLAIAVACRLCGINDVHWEIRGLPLRLFCGARVRPRSRGGDGWSGPVALDTLGYAAQLRRPNLQRALYELMVAARSPLLDDLAERPELLQRSGIARATTRAAPESSSSPERWST